MLLQRAGQVTVDKRIAQRTLLHKSVQKVDSIQCKDARRGRVILTSRFKESIMLVFFGEMTSVAPKIVYNSVKGDILSITS